MLPDNIVDDFHVRLQRRRKNKLYRSRSIGEGMTQPRRVVNGREVLSFCSNDYLGLAAHECVIKAFRRGAAEFGVGSGASALINGYTHAHHRLEEYLANFTGRERALLFSTGYMANLGVVYALAGRDVSPSSRLFEDRLNHASLLDAAVLSRAGFKRYPHKDTAALERMLDDSPEHCALVATDAVFSMDGDTAPLADLAETCTKHGATLLVDDAHGFGVFGRHGAGTLEQHGLSQREVPALVATFGKACGTFGAFVAGSENLIEWMIQEARTYIYTTALPPAVACATLESLRIIKNETWRRDKLHSNIALFRRLAHEAGLGCAESHTPIQPLVVGSAAEALAVSEELLADGLQVTAIRPPTVPQGTSRLRITVSAAHEAGDIEHLIEALTVHLRHVPECVGGEVPATRLKTPCT